MVDLKSGEAKTVAVTVPGDRPKLRRKKVDAAEFIEAADISPKGKRVVVEARGDLWTLPAKNGAPRNLTKTGEARERFPMWSNDGRWIAYFSDADGEFDLYITQSDGRGETRKLTDDCESFRLPGGWSPDSKYITFADKTGALYLHNIEAKETKKIDSHPYAEQMSVSWSHDSNWICYDKATDDRAATDCIWVYNVKDGSKRKLTSGFFNDSNPVFDQKGEYIYFSSSRAFNRPSYEDVGTTFIYAGTEVLMAMPLRADVAHPMLPKSDEVEWDEDDEDKDEDESDNESKESEDSDDEDEDGDEDEDEEDEDDDASTDDPVSGVWSIELDFDQIPAELRSATFNLELAEDGTVTGSVTAMNQTDEVQDGKFDKATGKLTFTSIPGGEDEIVTVTATIKDNEINGSATHSGQTIPFSGTREPTDDEDSDDDGKKSKSKKGKAKKKKDKPLEIEFEGIERRAFQLPVGQGNFTNLMVNHKNQLIYGTRPSRGSGGSAAIKLIDIHADKVESKTVVTGAAGFGHSGDLKKLLVMQGESTYIIAAAAGQKLDKKIKTNGMNLMVDPREEWKQIFWEAWRIERDYFYDPTMHGVDWKAIGAHYASMLDDCVSRRDVSFLIREMISELNVGHAYYRGSSTGDSGPDGNVGLLGCRFEIDGDRYKFAELYAGADWDSDARNPLVLAGVKQGQYLLEVDGEELKTDRNPYAVFEGLRGTTVQLTVSDDTSIDDDDKRVLLKTIGSDDNLRFRGWIEHNRKYVEEKSDGKIGYIYVVNTGVPGQNDLVRQFYGQMSKDALIIDDRWNGGGQIPTRFIELLNRPVTNYWARRDGRDWTWPPDAHFGPKCMLINGMAGSGGDMFPALFKQNKLGKLIGQRTWGGLVGISGTPSLVDGANVTSPSFAYYEKDGSWGIEGHGVDPDLKVIDDPAKMVDGGDPQLDVAVEQMLKELETSAYEAPKRPKYPDRSKMGIAPEDK